MKTLLMALAVAVAVPAHADERPVPPPPSVVKEAPAQQEHRTTCSIIGRCLWPDGKWRSNLTKDDGRAEAELLPAQRQRPMTMRTNVIPLLR